MTLLDDIDRFRTWATNMGCPPDALPNEDALKSIFKSRQRDLFFDMQKRVQPRQIVQETRENILIKKMNEMKDKVIPVSNRSFLPKEMQTHLKMQELNKSIICAQSSLEEVKKDFDVLAASIKLKNIQSISAEHKKEVLEAKCNILDLKRESLSQTIKQEVQNKQKLLANMPVKLNTKNASESEATKAVEQALNDLESFYNIHNSNNQNNVQVLQDAKQNLWTKMRYTFANVPNFLLFNVILKQKEEQLQNVLKLNKTETKDAQLHLLSKVSNKEPLNYFEIKILKCKADLLGLVAKYLNACNEVTVLEERFSKLYCVFVNELQKKVKNFNTLTDDECSEEIISDFIVQYNMRNFNKTRNDYLAQQIEYYRSEIEMGAKQLENHDVLLGSIKQVYSDINTSINRIQYEMLQLTQIKEKILYSKNVFKNMLADMQMATSQKTNTKNNFLTSKLKINNMSTSLMGVDSFELNNDSVFCSTKLDFDVNASIINTTVRRSFGSADATLMPVNTNIVVSTSATAAAVTAITQTTVMGVPTLPGYLLELNTFADIPLDKLNCLSRFGTYYLGANPVIIESRELTSTVQLAPGLLLTPFGALQEVRSRILWASSIAAQTTDSKLNLDTIIVDVSNLEQKNKQQQEKLSQLLDSIDVTANNTKYTLEKVEHIYNFILENPLRHFIPPNRCFNNLPYPDYESEYMMYYRTVDGSMK